MLTRIGTPVASLKVLLAEVIDYAGLFPPASLDMMSCVNNYSRYLHSPERWALGRFVLPVARLDEFLNAQENVASEPWHVTGIISSNTVRDLAAVAEFNRNAPGAVIDSIEARVQSESEISSIAQHLPPDSIAHFEISPEQAARLLPVIRRIGAQAKLRTGGVVEDAFPALTAIVEFISLCAEQRVPFKATAGLHHPLRSMKPLTYEPDARTGMMHGFLNLFTAAAIAWRRADAGNAEPRKTLASCLADEERANWHFDDRAMTWSGGDEPVRISTEALRATREHFAHSFGSCSFEEPLNDLHQLDLL